MHPVIATILAGLSYARFSNPEVRKGVYGLLQGVGQDIAEEYEAGSNVESMDVSLNKVLDELDISREQLRETIDSVAVDKVEGEDEVTVIEDDLNEEL